MISDLESTVHETISLENGAEAFFLRSGNLAGDKLHPMLVMLHGGPFGSSPKHFVSPLRNYLLMLGYTLLIVNFRGSTGYGKNSMDALLGNIGVVDVEDCGNLT